MVVRGDERARVYTSKQGLDLRNLSGRYGPFAIAGAEAVVEPRADSGPTPMRHPGEELVIVLEGRMEFTVDGEPHELARGRLDPLPHRAPALVAQSRATSRRARSGSSCEPRERRMRIVIAIGGNALIRAGEAGTLGAAAAPTRARSPRRSSRCAPRATSSCSPTATARRSAR